MATKKSGTVEIKVEQICDLTTIDTFHHERDAVVFHGDCVEILQHFTDNAFDVVFADPPYFGAHSSGRIRRTDGKEYFERDKASWAKSRKLIDQLAFHSAWLQEVQRVLKIGGAIWVTSSYHSSGPLYTVMQDLGFAFQSEIVLVKRNAPPNFNGSRFRALTENMLWAKKDKRGQKHFNYWKLKERNGGVQMNNVWEYRAKKLPFRHPATKQPFVVEGALKTSGAKGCLVLDPFAGSGTTSFVAKALGIQSVAIEINKDYCEVIQRRLAGELDEFIPSFPSIESAATEFFID